MGLDVYLYKVDDLAKAVELEKQFAAKDEEAYGYGTGKYDTLSNADKDAIRAELKEFAVSIGLPEDGDYPRERVEIDSRLYPEHYWKIGYFRSSYNNAGFNHVMRSYGLPNLYDIFEPQDEYEFAPNWEVSLERVKAAIAQLDVVRESDQGKYRAQSIRLFDEPEITDEQKALEQFHKRNENHASPAFRTFSSRDGFYCLDGMKVFGLVNGNSYGIQTIYAIIENDDSEWQYQRQCLEIAQETIEYVLAQPDREKFVFHWSS